VTVSAILSENITVLQVPFFNFQ